MTIHELSGMNPGIVEIRADELYDLFIEMAAYIKINEIDFVDGIQVDYPEDEDGARWVAHLTYEQPYV